MDRQTTNAVEFKMERLSAKNYSNWKIVMTSLLRSKKLFEYVDEPRKEIKTDEEDVKDEETKHLLYVSMDPSQISYTGTCQTAYDLWRKIKENNEGAEESLRNNALADFLGFRYNRGESIVGYCGRFELALGRLESTGHVVAEATKLWVFRNSLSKEMKATVNIWTLAKPEGKVSELISQLKIQHHMDRLDTTDNSVALYTNERRTAPRNNNRNNSEKPNQQPRQPNQQQTCSYCKQSGHYWNHCNKLKEDNKRKKHFGNRRNQNNQNNRPNNGNSHNRDKKPGQSGAFMSREARECHNFALNEHSWIVDSGATSHMTPHREFMLDYKPFEENKSITLGDGKTTAAYGEGRIPFKSDKFYGELHSVLWVPELTENLFSVSKALSQGSEVKFINNPPTVEFFKHDKVALRGNRQFKGLFVLNLESTANEQQNERAEIAYNDASLEEWHQRFAHCSINSIKDLIKSNAVTGIQIRANNHQACEECIKGKICRAHHPSKAHIEASENAAVLHIDTCGPFSTESLGGSRYFILAVEEYSHYKLIDLARTKGETPDMIKKMINKTEILSKRPVKMIVSDNAKEYLAQELRNWLDKRGIIHTTSTAYVPEQNGRVERANRTIVEGIRTLLTSCDFSDEDTIRSLWAEAAATVVHSHNLTLSSRDRSKTKFELYMNRKPDVKHLRVFGQRAIVRLNDRERSGKLSSKGEEYRFVGYTDRSNTYKFYSVKKVTIITSCDAVFLKNNEPIEKGMLGESHHRTIKIPLGLKTQQESKIDPMRRDNTDLNITMNRDHEDPLSSTLIGSSFDDDSTILASNATNNDTDLTQTNSEVDVTGISYSSAKSNLTTPGQNYPASPGTAVRLNTRNTRSNTNLKDVTIHELAKKLTIAEKPKANPESALFTLDEEPRTLKDA